MYCKSISSIEHEPWQAYWTATREQCDFLAASCLVLAGPDQLTARYCNTYLTALYFLVRFLSFALHSTPALWRGNRVTGSV